MKSCGIKSWDDVHNGDVVISNDYDVLYDVIEYDGNKYISGKYDMWIINQFDPKDFCLYYKTKG